jgi:type II secretory pathway pseudopilin PulG
MDAKTGYRGRGFVPLEMLAVICIIAVLLGLGVVVVSSARQQAHLAQAEGQLKQVSLALDLYYKHYGYYPPPGSDLSRELGPFVQNPKVFISPLTGGGKDLSAMYESLTLEELDEAENYVAAFFDDDGETAVILKTLGKIVRKTDLRFNPDIPLSAKFAIVTAVGLGNGDETAVASENLDTGEDTLEYIAKYTLDCATQDKTAVSIDKYAVEEIDGAIVDDGAGPLGLPDGIAGEDGIVFEAEDGDQLGGVAGTDTFVLNISNPEGDVSVGDIPVTIQLKSGRDTFKLKKEPMTLDQLRVHDGPIDLVNSKDKAGEPTGWTIEVDYTDAGEVTVTFEVSTNGKTQDLSNIEFTLGSGVDILGVEPVRRTVAAPQ